MDLSFNPLYVGLYPEIHYTFDLFFSRLRHSEPEIVIDCPFRTDPGKSIPVLCIIKHANRFPISLHSISIEISYEGGAREKETVLSEPIHVRSYLWYRVFYLQPPDGYSGEALISTHIEIEARGRRNRILTHNYRGVRQSPLRVHIAKEPLPALENWHYGEPHCHTFHSDDQVEFGAPLPATVEMAAAMGLRWLAITDHSYDLDDVYSNTLKQDHNLLKWRRLKEQVEKENAAGTVRLILGEEVSCGNARSKNVHVLAFGIKNFIPGAGDGAERWFRTRPDVPLREVLKSVEQDGGVAYASHPEDRFTLGERLMLRRGHWEREDYDLPKYAGLQFWNGKQDKAFYEGYKRWVEMLLSGRHIYFIGGNDSHGDFNLFRQVRVPLLRMIDSSSKVFGKVRTCLCCRTGVSEATVLYALKHGNSFVSSGPFLACEAENERGERAGLGGQISGRTIVVEIKARVTDEFGDLERIVLCEGNLTKRTEAKRDLRAGSDFHDLREVTKNLTCHVAHPVYFRVEAVSRRGEDLYHAYTNPIWLNPG